MDKFLSQIILNKTPVKWSDSEISSLIKVHVLFMSVLNKSNDSFLIIGKLRSYVF